MTGTFRSLRGHNYRVWAGGALMSNIGTWMQRTAQDWLVLTQLTHHNATAVGIVSALQFGPQILMLPWSGFAADHLALRKLLLVTQTALGLLALGIGLLTVSGHVQLWHVYVFAFLLGCVTAFDTTASQTFVSELVADHDLTNAVALNSTSFSLARMVGPAAAGLLIATIGTGWVFLVNAASYGAVLVALACLRPRDLHPAARAARRRGSLVEGVHYVWTRPDLRVVLVMLFLVGTFGLNFAIFISIMAVGVFHTGAGNYGLLYSAMAIGTLAGALLAASRATASFAHLIAGAAVFGLGCALAALAPGIVWFGAALAVIGVAALTFTTATSSLMQLSTDRAMRGRVLSIRLAVAQGGTPIGAPIIGLISDAFGPRWSLAVGAGACLLAAAVGGAYLAQGTARERGPPASLGSDA